MILPNFVGLCTAWYCRLAQSVLSREDPREVFLKAVPAEPTDVEVIYPVSVSPCRHSHCVLPLLLDCAAPRPKCLVGALGALRSLCSWL